MAPSPAKGSGNGNLSTGGDDTSTYASFSPSQSYASPATKQRSTILVHKKSPLLIATPPSVTRALAFSHPFILPLNKVVGLLSWSSGDPWESFLVVAAFWAVTLYGDVILQWAGPLVLVVFLIIGMYSRRYSPLSSTGWTGEKVSGQKDQTEGSMKHQKSLDEIVDILTIFTSRCNTLLEPFLALTDFLSTQQTATSATTRPALTTLFIRILFVSPFWIFMTIPPVRVITTRRVILTVGTLILSWHSRPARVSRAILWRSLTIRRAVALTTGLELVHTVPPDPQGKKAPPPLPPRHKSQDSAANAMCKQSLQSKGVRFTFVVFENQRRWLGLGWTRSLLAYERAPWTDEQLNPSNSKDNFQLPHIDGASAKWQWVEGSEWKVERGGKSKTGDEADGWIFYDNKWNNGHRGQDGWGRYTRRRKWYRDAELVEIPETEMASSVATLVPDTPSKIPAVESSKANQVPKETDDSSSSQKRRRGFLRRDSRSSTQSGAYSASSTLGIDDSDHLMPMDHDRNNADWGVGDDIKMGLG
ncbi:MAG: hypothetical protein LQ348_003216 [Seirophora lacunosa]|nr:MAG: hypothetical protein LQ344_000823 [Seirophora lacunosa]KAI4192272.1 MAG: hypothetical protein LQ348_003216 [Seirophora lacunosa]